MIVNTQDFKGEAYIPLLRSVAPDSDVSGNETELQWFIDEYESEALILILGYELFVELKGQFTDNELNDNADAKWIELVKGDGRYKGLKRALVYYIFYKFLENDIAKYSGVGLIKEGANGASSYSAREKLVKAWQLFYDSVVGVHGGNQPIFIQKPNGAAIVWSSSQNYSQSIHDYLVEKKDVFTTATFAYIPKLNYYDV